MAPITRVTLLRHGTTDANESGLFLGQTDVPINACGQAEANALAARLQDIPIDRIVSSDLARARETAETICLAHRTPLELQTDRRLREMHLGDLEMAPAKEVHEKHPQLIQRWLQDPQHVRMPGPDAESLLDVQTRAWEAIHERVQAEPGTHLAFVTHTFTLLTVLCRALGFDIAHFRRFHVDRASVSTLEWRPTGPVLRVFNDTAHLSKGKPSS